MSDSRMLFKFQNAYLRECRTTAKLEQIMVNQRVAQDTLVSVACAFTWDLVFGNAQPTDAELLEASKGVK